MSLRYGKSFIDNLHRNLDYLSSLLTEYRAEVLHVFDAAGPGRRTMQIICAHGKTIKNGLIVNLVPAVQKSLEGFIYKVKAVCLKNGLKDRFNHGVLKARRIDGSVIEEDDEDEETDSAEESVNQMHSGNSDDMDGNEVPQEYSDPEL